MQDQRTQLRVDQGASYRIIVQGRLDRSWSDWFQASQIQLSRNPQGVANTTMVVTVADQAALYGWLSHLCDLGLPLLKVEYLGVGPKGEQKHERAI